MKGRNKAQLNPLLKQQALEKLLASCPFCESGNSRFTTGLISGSRDAELVHIRCQSCQAAMVALLFSTGPLISSIGLLTDLTLEDVSRFQRQTIVSEDDLLDWHELLQQSSGIEQLLKHV